MIKQVIQQLSIPEASIESLQERRFGCSANVLTLISQSTRPTGD